MKTFTGSDYKNFLNHIPPFSDNMTLDGISCLLKELDDFHLQLPIIHVGGTNGKGSSTRMLSAIYKAGGYKVGTFTSPYIFDYRECIHLNDSEISIDLMNQATSQVANAYEVLKQKNLPLPTHYECITVVAFLAMFISKVDIAIIEVLMGGLNDATNVITTPLASLITSISLDHTEYLGPTIEDITFQKAGIIKKQCPVVLNSNMQNVIQLIQDRAKHNNAPYYYSPITSKTLYSLDQLDLFSNTLTLKGQHQIDNLSGVLTLISLLAKTYPLTSKNIIKGLSSVIHPCRIEHIKTVNHSYIIDGSHNEEGIKALLSYLKSTYPNYHFTFILGILKDKDLPMIKEHIYSLADKVILTEPLSPRKFSIQDFFDTLTSEEKAKTTKEPDVKEVFSQIKSNTPSTNNHLYVVCGSLYISYPFRKMLLEKADISSHKI